MAAQDVIIPADSPIAGRSQADGRAERALAAASGQARFEPGSSAVELKLSLVDVRNRLRAIDPTGVADIIVSVTEGVLGHPITVRPMPDGRFELVIGAHRLEAFRQMGRTTIPAQIRVMSAIEARQLEIDENLIRSGLTALDKMAFLAERVEVWAARNPEKVVMDATQPIKLRGRPPKAFLKLRKVHGYVPAMMGFVAETARDTGLSRQSVYRATASLAGLPADQRERLHGTWIAKNDAALRQLATLGDAAEQAAVIDILLLGRTKNIAEARAYAAGSVPAPKPASNDIQRAFEKAWKAATQSERAGMLHWLSGRPLPKGWNIMKSEGEG